jgi:hypothetical protein
MGFRRELGLDALAEAGVQAGGRMAGMRDHRRGWRAVSIRYPLPIWPHSNNFLLMNNRRKHKVGFTRRVNN